MDTNEFFGGTEKTMQTIGLLGGMSWESTALYFRMINESVILLV